MRAVLGILVCAAVVLAGCADSRSGALGGETGQWLMRCEDDDGCELGSCLCGVCTQRCSASKTCSGDFTGSCTASTDRAARLLCGPSPRPAVDALCLPTCNTNAECGSGFACEAEVCIVRRGGTPPPSAGKGGTADARVDGCVAGMDAGCGPVSGPPLIERIAQSRAAWKALLAVNGDRYWYTEENCGPNGVRDGTVVQVEAGAAKIVRRYEVENCPAFANRYGTWTARTMEEAHDECTAIVNRNRTASITTDAEGVLMTCLGPPDAPGCADNCGDGFAISHRGFGAAPTNLVRDAGF